MFENGVAQARRCSARPSRSSTPDALLGSNTSTLPITGLAEGVERKQDFIGLHFFSPVDKMPLVEIIRGEQTSDEALARALDYAAQIKKTPIVVNDSRGFFTSRVIGTFVNEALAMLGEGIAPATIEQATTQAGYPVGALQLADELNLELFLKIRNEAREARGRRRTCAHPAEAVVEKMVELGRPGRLRGAGFFDYDETASAPASGRGWPSTSRCRATRRRSTCTSSSERMLVIEAVESARCVEEGVIVQTADANIGSIMGIGFPPWTGGVLQYINGYPGGVGRVRGARRRVRRQVRRAVRAEPAAAQEGRERRDVLTAVTAASRTTARYRAAGRCARPRTAGDRAGAVPRHAARRPGRRGDPRRPAARRRPARRRARRRPAGPRPALDRAGPAQAGRRRGRAAAGRAAATR